MLPSVIGERAGCLGLDAMATPGIGADSQPTDVWWSRTLKAGHKTFPEHTQGVPTVRLNVAGINGARMPGRQLPVVDQQPKLCARRVLHKRRR